MFKTSILNASLNLPLIIEPESERTACVDGLLSLFSSNADELEARLLVHGAALFRGFKVNTPSAFARCLRAISPDLLDYVDGNSPRTKLASGIYTSTEYPAEYFISLHNELSYSQKWPSRLFFCCIVAPEQGGETPIADSRAILRNLDASVTEEFNRKGVKYIRNLHGERGVGRGIGPSWQDTFETEDRSSVEQFCAQSGIDFAWRKDGGLKLSQVRPAIESHPVTNERLWFNQADQFHPSTHPKPMFEYLSLAYWGKEDEMPQNARYGDNTLIDPQTLDHIREVTFKQAVVAPWRAGDFLMIDNMLTCHGRMPFSGPRKILVAMSQ